MGYYCSCSDVKFFMKAEDIEGALRQLAPTEYGPPGIEEKDVYKICDTKDEGGMQNLLDEAFGFSGYGIDYDDEGNVVDVCFNNEKWHDDTLFFDVFAKFVEKGSYIEMSGEDGEMWRMVFDGEHCREVNAVISWPEYDEVVSGAKTPEQQAIDFINKNPALARAIYDKLKWDYRREDVLVEIAQRPDVIELNDADVDAITDNFSSILSKNDSYYESYWLSAGEAVGDFVREHTKKPALSDVITEAQASVVEPDNCNKDKCEVLHI